MGSSETIEESGVGSELRFEPQGPPGKHLAGFVFAPQTQEELSV
jgi:hypothetical protein